MPSTVQWSVDRYGLPAADVLDKAAALLDVGAPIGPDASTCDLTIDSRRAVDGIRRTLEVNAISGWRTIYTEPIAAMISVRPLAKTLFIRPDARFTEAQLTRLLVHEIGSHVLRAVNAEAQPDQLATYGFGRSTATEEGLAVWREDQSGLLQDVDRRKYAARALGVHLAMSSGITDVAKRLRPLVGPSMAAEIAVRVKRGLREPERPGVMAKDHCYLSGFLSVSDHLSDKPEDISLLMSTKWPLDLLDRVRSLVSRGDLEASKKTRIDIPSIGDLFHTG